MIYIFPFPSNDFTPLSTLIFFTISAISNIPACIPISIYTLTVSLLTSLHRSSNSDVLLLSYFSTAFSNLPLDFNQTLVYLFSAFPTKFHSIYKGTTVRTKSINLIFLILYIYLFIMTRIYTYFFR